MGGRDVRPIRLESCGLSSVLLFAMASMVDNGTVQGERLHTEVKLRQARVDKRAGLQKLICVRQRPAKNRVPPKPASGLQGGIEGIESRQPGGSRGNPGYMFRKGEKNLRKGETLELVVFI